MDEKYIVKSKQKSFEISDTLSVSELMSNKLNALNSNNTCIIDATTNTKLTVKELIDKSNALAMALIAQGVNKFDIILTFAENCIDLVVAFIASTFLGTTLYPISPIANFYEMNTLLETLGSLVIFTSKLLAPVVEKVLNDKTKKINIKSIILMNGDYNNYTNFDSLITDNLGKTLPKIPYFDVNPKKDAFILLQSSGTTGIPKSLVITHRAYAISQNFNVWTPGEKPVFGHITPFGCVSGAGFLFGFLSLGVPIVIYRLFNDELILKSIEDYKITFMFIVPAFGHKLIAGPLVDKYDLSSLKFLVTGGAAFSAHVAKSIIKKHDIKFQEGYGMTEFGMLTDWLNIDPENDEYIPGNLGRPIVNSQMKVIDLKNGHNLGPNSKGEICIRGPQMFSCYLNNIEATNEAIDSDGWLHTGDVGHYDQSGRFFITDRLKELIKYNTKQVSPTEVEQFLMTHKCVAEVAVVGVRHETQNQWVRAYVKVKDNMNVTEDEIKKYVSDNMNDAKHLRAGVIFVDHIPRTTVGKVDRRYFKKLIANEIIKET